MVRGRLNFNDIDGLPAWASWSSGEEYLPDSFYNDRGGIELAIADIGGVSSSVDSMEATLVLALGLALQGIDTLRENNAASDLPADSDERLEADRFANDAEGRILNIIQCTM
jgi:hypothetical protein